MFSLIAFQDRLIERLGDIEYNGIGRHKRRSRAAAYRDGRAELVRLGYTEQQAEQIVADAKDMATLLLECN